MKYKTGKIRHINNNLFLRGYFDPEGEYRSPFEHGRPGFSSTAGDFTFIHPELTPEECKTKANNTILIWVGIVISMFLLWLYLNDGSRESVVLFGIFEATLSFILLLQVLNRFAHIIFWRALKVIFLSMIAIIMVTAFLFVVVTAKKDSDKRRKLTSAEPHSLGEFFPKKVDPTVQPSVVDQGKPKDSAFLD